MPVRSHVGLRANVCRYTRPAPSVVGGRGVKMSRKLYVGNLSYQTEAPELQQLFEQAGTVEGVKVMKDMATGRSRGFAFVEMGTDEEAAKAISELNACPVRRTQSHGQRGPPQDRAWRRLHEQRFAPQPQRTALVTRVERERSQPNVGWLFFLRPPMGT